MGKLRVLSGREVCAILARHGFLEVRRRGSHIVMQKKLLPGTVTIPVPDHEEIRIGTLQSIIRQSNIQEVSLRHERNAFSSVMSQLEMESVV